MITIATDGSSIGNPGPGAYAIYADLGSEQFGRAIACGHTTVGEMEVRALLEALLFIIHRDIQEPVLIQSDSQYVVNGYNEWMAGWKAKGWTKKGGLAHAGLWEQISNAKAWLQNSVTVVWVKAHQINGSLNDKVDQLANSCARSQIGHNGPPAPPISVRPSSSDNGVRPVNNAEVETSIDSDAARARIAELETVIENAKLEIAKITKELADV